MCFPRWEASTRSHVISARLRLTLQNCWPHLTQTNWSWSWPLIASSRRQYMLIKNWLLLNHQGMFVHYEEIAQNALQCKWGFVSFTNGSCCNGICWGLPLRLAQFIKIHCLPHLESFMWKQKFENKFFKKDPIQPTNGELLICKLPFPNGSYRNGVCRGLWAKLTSFALTLTVSKNLLRRSKL